MWRVTNLLTLFFLSLQITPAFAHVRMIYIQGQPGPIRNSNSPTGNGAASVAGPCGGQNTFGSNGQGTITDGDQVTLNINYAAGHRSNANAFRMAYACGTTTQNAMRAAASTLTATNNGCTAKAAGAPALYNDNGVGGSIGVAAPNAIVTGGYEVTCTLPLKAPPIGGAPLQCTISLLDQRQWGGCVDVLVQPAAVALPPSTPPPPTVSNSGVYAFLRANAVDSAPPDASWSCCIMDVGKLTVPDYTPGVASFTASLEAGASGCRTSALPSAPTTQKLSLNQPLLMSLDFGSKYSGTTQLLGQPFQFDIDSARLQFANVGAADPIVCDGFAVEQALAINPGDTGGSGTGGDAGVAVGITAAVLAVLALAGAGFWYSRKNHCQPARTDGMPIKSVENAVPSPPPGPKFTTNVPPPPPKAPPPPKLSLPPGWQTATDPSNGRMYYFNQGTGVSSWTHPSEGKRVSTHL